MALRLLIDGYNLLGAAPEAGLDIDERRDDLVNRLAVYKKVRGVKVTVVFDAARSGRLTRSREMKAGVETIFSKNNEDADSVIKELAVKGGPSLTVVSSDRELCSYVKSRGAVTISSGEFAELLDAALYEGLKGVAPEDEDEGPHPKKGPSKRPSKQERRGLNRLKKL